MDAGRVIFTLVRDTSAQGEVNEMIPVRLWLSATFLTFFCAFYSLTSFALGTGRLVLDSALNEKFSAEIALVNTRGLTLDELQVNLATQDDFDRLGVKRSDPLLDLQFDIHPRDERDFYIKVSSSLPVQEPLLNFILEVRWPHGRIVREYGVLLSPPELSTSGESPITPAQSQADEEPVLEQDVSTSSKLTPPDTSPTTTEDDAVAKVIEFEVTKPGDTLWKIASRVRPDESVSMQQTMLALQRMNPKAFLHGNINLLQSGQILRIPDISGILADTVISATDEIQTQHREYESLIEAGVVQIDGELRLLAADIDSGQGTRSGDSRITDLENELAVVREDLDGVHRTNMELNARLDTSAQQIETLHEIIRVKDAQLAAVEAELRDMREKAAAAFPLSVLTGSGPVLANPWVLAGLGVLIVGGLAIIMVFLRRRREEADLEQEFDTVGIEETDQEATDVEAAPEVVDGSEEVAEEAVDEEAGEAVDDSAEPDDTTLTDAAHNEDLDGNVTNKLDLAQAYIEMGDTEEALTLLEQVIAQGDELDAQVARELVDKLS